MILIVTSFNLIFDFVRFRAASDKAKKDASAFVCKICRQTFMVNAKPSLLYVHVTAKHADKADTPWDCFDQLVGFEKDDPDMLKKNGAVAAVAPVKPKKVVKKDDDLSALLDAGLKVGKKK